MISFACFSPHPPILLESVGSEEDRKKLKKTFEGLEKLNKKFSESSADILLISSPHPNWGFNVPIYFIAKDFQKEIKPFLIEDKDPLYYFNSGKDVFKNMEKEKKYGLIASGDMSHCLKESGPYGFNQDGPEFDKKLIEFLKNKDINSFLKLGSAYPEAGECGLRSFSFLLGVLEAAEINWQAEILSYEFPFGVGYLVVDFKL